MWSVTPARFWVPSKTMRIANVPLRRRTTFADDDRIECDLQIAAAVLAFEVGFAEEPVKRDIVRAMLGGRSEDGRVGERLQHDRARASLDLLSRG
jgi:hypothetical protein